MRLAGKAQCRRSRLTSNVRPRQDPGRASAKKPAMKHASSAALELLSSLLEGIRHLPGLNERKLGTFYVKSSAYLHFHEDPTGLYADVKLNGREFERFPVASEEDQQALLSRLHQNRTPSA
jgi:hypothetical protein